MITNYCDPDRLPVHISQLNDIRLVSSEPGALLRLFLVPWISFDIDIPSRPERQELSPL
jgi:hypothetical protein